ncbi:MAG: FkbM family methyltransferase [Burkholderiales bacterium]|nr:FkbM family methyltransferase [Burkholderiales bacterium]
MKFMKFVQTALNGATRRFRDAFPEGYWISTASALGKGVFEYTPASGPLAGAPVRLRVDHFIFPSVMATGSWQPEQHRVLGRHVGPSTMLVDIGANLGFFTRQMFQEFPHLARAICFEPDDENYDILQKNLEHLRDHICLVNAALSEGTGKAELHRDPLNVGNYSLLVNATPEGDKRTVATMSVVEAEGLILREAGSSDLVYKSDTQGYDEYIACRFSGEFWGRVSAAALEIWQLPGKPALDAGRFAEILSGFPYRFFDDRPDRNLDVEEIVAFAQGASNVGKDLFLQRRPA